MTTATIGCTIFDGYGGEDDKPARGDQGFTQLYRIHVDGRDWWLTALDLYYSFEQGAFEPQPVYHPDGRIGYIVKCAQRGAVWHWRRKNQ